MLFVDELLNFLKELGEMNEFLFSRVAIGNTEC